MLRLEFFRGAGILLFFFFFFQAEDGIRDLLVTGVQTCALPISRGCSRAAAPVCGFSRSTTARSVSLSWGAREVGSPCEWRGGARHCSRAIRKQSHKLHGEVFLEAVAKPRITLVRARL